MSISKEHCQQISGWNQTTTEFPRRQTVAELFAAQVAATPDAIALEFDSLLLSYQQLNQRANRLAHYLIERGVGAEVRVGLFLPRGLDMVVALLGILKAGGAYVPLDLEYPSARIAFMLEDANAALLLSTSDLSAQLAEFPAEVICLDEAQIEQQSAQNPETACTAENLAYVIYTSGSTGTPKGVEIQHRAINRLVRNTNYYQVDGTDRVVHASSVSFDAATFEVWGALLNGARLVGIDKDDFLNPRILADFLQAKGITAMFVTTAVFNQVARELPSAFSNLKCLMFGGEAVDCGAVRTVLANHPPKRLLHVYGPTESTTFASWYPLEAVPDDATTVPIGRPLANTTLQVLDQQMKPVATGVAGELYIGGEGLARGYLNQVELTAERFVTNPFDDDPASRLYRTGDKVCYRDDGAIEFIGRFDDQVKLRGFRIELGEVETAIRSHSGISDAVVSLMQGHSGEQQLVAHVVNVPNGSANRLSELREYLQQKLPPYMLPAFYVPLDVLPLTPNGKVDRGALPQPDSGRGHTSSDYLEPRNELERKLAAIWADVLGLEQIGVNDHFLELGGQSLLATRIVTRIREILQLDLSLADFYQNLDVASLALRLGHVSPEAGHNKLPAIYPAPRNNPIPVSFPQEQVIFLSQLSPESLAYNTQMGIRFTGKLDIPVLQRSLNEILRRHEIFRTSFAVVDGQAIQQIHPEWTAQIPVVNLCDVSQQSREERVAEVIDEEIHQKFNIGEIPLVRWKLVKITADEHLLIHVEHHLVHDGWSFGVFIQELQTLYAAYSSGAESPLPELPIQFADYVIWQRQRLQGETLQNSLNYWKNVLAGPLPALQLPTDFQRPAIQSHRGTEEVVDLSPEMADQLRELSRRESSTLYVTALTIFFVLLHKYSDQQDLVIGTGVANRNVREVEGLIGMMINTIALRADLSGDPTFRELVRRIHDMAFEAYEFQELPFERLVDELQLKRDLSYNPLFQVLFGFHDSQVPAIEVPGLSGEVKYLHNGSAKFDLNLVVIPWAEQQSGLDSDVQDRRITMKWEYATDLFTQATIRGMTSHYLNLVQELIRYPDKPISELSMLGDAERYQLIEGWNQTTTDYPADRTVHELFEMQAAASPDAIALDYAGDRLTYTELNQRANQLAHYLQTRGVGPEVKVGLYLQRGLEAIIGLLGIIKAGGAYVPLDLDYPQSRIAFMLEDAGVPVLLTTSDLDQGLPDFAGERICLDSDWIRIATESADNPVSAVDADSLAYVIYTSGSTGRPKGVEIPQRAIIRLVRETDYYQVTATDRIAQASNLSFDAATFEVWGALLNGARLVGIDKENFLNSRALASLLQQEAISAMFITTAVFNQVAREAPDAFNGLKCLMFGGEAVDCAAVRRVLAKQPPERLLHVYGPTESTTFASWHRVEEVALDASTVPIGRPLANTTLYVLDQQMQPVPVGVPGELYIGGAGLARGYWQRDALTAERFVSSPFNQERLYRTGDQVRYRRDAAIEFVGRFDDQVKIRGFRIEPGEIEALLARHKTVQEAIVLVHEVDAGDKRLFAYVVGEPDAVLDVTELRSHVRQHLPDYMLPAAFMLMDEFPVTANGKLDRQALPLPEDLPADMDAAYMPPRSELEQRLTQIWVDVLKLERIGIHDNFFDLGGHSLLATQVVSRIRAQLNVELPLAGMFSCPTLAELSPVVEGLQDAVDGATAEVIPLADRKHPLSLSFAQERLWFLDQLEPGSIAYNVPLAIRLQGELDVGALEQSLQAMVQRHEVLRTRFAKQQEHPLQVIEAARLELLQDDLSALNAEQREAELESRIDEEALQPFNLGTGPLLRCRLWRLASEEWVLMLSMHHVVSDGWSLGVFFRELAALYVAFCRGQPNPLPALALQYADFAMWQRQRLSGELLQVQLDYWKQQLEDLGTLQLPTDRPRPPVQTYSGVHRYITLEPELSDKLDRFTRQQGATPFMVLLAAFNILLQRYSGQDEIVVGSPIANRNHRGIEDLVGFFVNSLVLRNDLSGDPSFVELLERVKTVALEAYQHQDLPFELLVDELQPQRDRSRNPLFQVMFVVQNAPDQSLSLQGLSLERIPLEVKTTHFDLEFHAWQEAGQLKLKIAYNTDLFDAETIEGMFRHYQTLLAAILSDPARPVSELSMLDDSERLQLLEGWNDTTTDYPADKTLNELFETQAAASPDAIALDYQGTTLNYAELNQRANRLAHYLQARGVGPEVKVGLCLERGLELIVGLLGILKAGGAYLPLDPDYPESRLAFMLEDAQAPILLSLSSLSERLPEFGGERIDLDNDWAQIEKESTQNPVSGATADNLIYVIYTSGSTGRPKGTLIEHRSAVRLVKQTNYVELGADDVMLQFAPVAFDASTFEIWGSLLNGARLAVFPSGRSALEKLGEFIQQKQVTTLWLTSALFSQMVDNHLPSLSGVRQILAGGEALSLPQVQKMLGQLDDGARLINGYGPTENTTFTCCHVMTRDTRLGQSVPIGRPISNTRVYILDGQMQPVPVGVPGELYIGGDGLARGYLNQAELTAEKFIEDPFTARARLYRTGDEVRYRQDGTIEFLGRFDDQLKLRGFRIEPGEIETLLVQHETIQDAAVVLHGEDADDRQLVAYVVVEQDSHPEVAELRSHLRRHLPEYMLPAAFMVLDEFPLTANGKLDRQALPLPDDLPEQVDAYMPPRSELEAQLAQIWGEVLKREQIGVDDNFFDLGGHSLLATQVVSRIRAQLNVELPLSDLFDYPTVTELAAMMRILLDDGEGEQAEVIPVVDRSAKLPLSFAQERLWFLNQLEPDSSVYNINLALRLKGELHEEALSDSLNAIVAGHESLRTRFAMYQEAPIQVIEDVTIELLQEDLSELSAQALQDEISRRIDAETFQPFDLATGPLLRGNLLRLSRHEHVLLLTMHHIISDGWSMGVMFRQLGECYAAISAGKHPNLRELPFQYADFAAWQRDWLSGRQLELQLDYWRHKLKDLAALNLPSDHPRPVIPSYAGAFATLQLDADLSGQLQSLSKQTGVTLFMTLLAGFAVLMQRYSGQNDIAIGTPIANRQREEMEGLIGLFVNMLVMRTQVHPNINFTDLLAQVQTTALEAYQHQNTPFEKLVEILHPERDRSRNPLFQVLFALQNAPIEPLELQGLTLEPIESEGHSTRMDLECHIWPRAAGLEVIIVYNTDLYAAATIERMLGHYRNLLQSAVASPDQAVSELSMLSVEEQRQFDDWNPAPTDYPPRQTIHELFEQQVAKTPQAAAVEFDGNSLSYAQLNSQANKLAHYLQSKGVGADVIVAICVERSLQMIVGLLAILKAGGAYLPLDRDYPVERLSYMLEDSGAPLLLGKGALPDGLVAPDTRIICLDRDATAIAEQVGENPASGAMADNLAFVMYTSGSTGKPKAVLGLHRAIVNRVTWGWAAYPYQAGDRCCQKTTLNFVDSIPEIFSPLLAGLELVVANEATAKDVHALARLVSSAGVTHLVVVPSLLHAMLELDEEALSGLECVRCWLAGGERLEPELEFAFHARFPDAVLLNMYGASEFSGDATCFDAADRGQRVGSLIGRPIANTRAYVLDDSMNRVPLGVPGELYVGGAGMARGYLNQSELTAEKFVPDPFSEEPGARLYRMGDRVRYLADGSLEYFGRIDDQVKLRGFRIELGEIEMALAEQESIRDAVAMIREDEPGDRQLVVYLVAALEWIEKNAATSKGPLTEKLADERLHQQLIPQLRHQLRQRLPVYMIPSVFVLLEEIPVSPNGKVDRAALPAVGDVRVSLGTELVMPRTELEVQLARIWAEVLKIECLGIHDNFFDLGGHSLMATQVMSRIHRHLQVELPVAELFVSPTVAELAQRIESNRLTCKDVVAVGFEQIDRVNVEIDDLDLEALSDRQVAELLSELGAKGNSYGNS